ncbi:hypothetical protein ABZ990_14090 [Streptomyces sp. NPDC046203]|uniref:hypothetical protein n=1 Tax=Streptomyces sp. NPDC046203 TaxID=3154602 RepID=UPI0033E22CF8
MNRWTACAAVAAGAALLALYLTDVVATVPYSVFAVLAGTALVVDGLRKLYRLRRPPKPRDEAG